MRISHRIGICCVVAVFGACVADAAVAARGATAPIKAAIDDRIAHVEKQIAQRMLRRAQTAADKLPRLDMEIDLRIVLRWLLSIAENASAASEMQVAAYLRADLWADCMGALEGAIGRVDRLTAAQTDGMARLHKLSFGLPGIKSVKELDESSRQLGILLLLISSPGPEGEKAPPPMRPRPMRTDEETEARPVAEAVGAATRTDEQMAEAAARLSVSGPLRQQLANVGSALVNAKDVDRAACRKMLQTALELAEGLHANIGVSADVRADMEAQLAEGLALFMDARTRAAGQAQVAGLQQYRQIVALIHRLKLTPEQMAQFQPVFIFARRNHDQGAKAMGLVERFIEQQSRFGARGQPPASMPLALRKQIDELGKQFSQASAAFCADAAAGNLKEMEQRGQSMQRLIDVLVKLDQMPGALETIGSFKPKQFVNLERRVAAAASVIASSGKQQGEAAKFINDVHQLGKTAAELSGLASKGIGPQIDARYAGGKLAAMEAKWKSIITDLASTAASGGGEMDEAMMGRLSVVRTLYDALRHAVALEARLAGSESLGRWVDWRLGPEEVQAILAARAAALSDAVGGFVNDTPAGLERWPKVEARYRPLVAMVLRCGRYREQCGVLPGGFVGLGAMLMTPLEGAPFAAERHASFIIRLWRVRSIAGDRAGAEELLTMLGK